MHLTLLLSTYFRPFQSVQRQKNPKHLAYSVIGWQIRHGAQNPRVFLPKGNNSWNHEANRIRSDERTHRYPSDLPYILQIPRSSKFLPDLGEEILSCLCMGSG